MNTDISEMKLRGDYDPLSPNQRNFVEVVRARITGCPDSDDRKWLLVIIDNHLSIQTAEEQNAK